MMYLRTVTAAQMLQLTSQPTAYRLVGAGEAYAGNAYTKNNYADAVKTRTKWRYCEAIGIQMLFMNDCFDKFEMDQVSGKQLIWNTSYILAYEI